MLGFITLLRHHSGNVKFKAPQHNPRSQQLSVLHLITQNRNNLKQIHSKYLKLLKQNTKVNPKPKKSPPHFIPGLLKTVPMSILKWPTMLPCLRNFLSDIT